MYLRLKKCRQQNYKGRVMTKKNILNLLGNLDFIHYVLFICLINFGILIYLLIRLKGLFGAKGRKHLHFRDS